MWTKTRMTRLRRPANKLPNQHRHPNKPFHNCGDMTEARFSMQLFLTGKLGGEFFREYTDCEKGRWVCPILPCCL